MKILTAVDVARRLVDAGFTGWSVVTMGAICVPESWNYDVKAGRDCHAHHLNDHDPAKASYLSMDWGLFAVNDFWSTGLLVARGILRSGLPVGQQLLDPDVNVAAARSIFTAAGGDLDARLGYARWNAWLRNLHLPYLAEARAAARQVGVAV